MSSRPGHVLLCTGEDPWSQRSWSGIPYSLRQALESVVDRVSVCQVTPVRHPVDIIRRFYHGGASPRYPLWAAESTLRANAAKVRRSMEELRPDAVLSISSMSIARLARPACPVFFFSDSPWLAWREAYAGTIPGIVREPEIAAAEAETARRIDGMFFGSAWAVEEAKRLYTPEGASEAWKADFARRLHVTPLGANWIPPFDTRELLERAQRRITAPECLELLFVGRDWIRKGGPTAFEAAQTIHDRGLPVRLHIVGCRPELPPEAEAFTEVHGLLRRDDEESSKKLTELFLRSHFMISPTTAECFGIAFVESQAFAVPPVSRRIHALPSVVEDGVTGILLDPNASAAEYADRILAVAGDPARYMRMCGAARSAFETHFNWGQTAATMADILGEYLSGDRQALRPSR